MLNGCCHYGRMLEVSRQIHGGSSDMLQLEVRHNTKKRFSHPIRILEAKENVAYQGVGRSVEFADFWVYKISNRNLHAHQ